MSLTESPKLDALLCQMGIHNASDVLFRLPRRYDSFLYTDPSLLYRLQDKQRVVLYGKLASSPKTMRFSRLSKTTFLFLTEEGMQFSVSAWNRPYLSKAMNMEEFYTIQASCDEKNHGLNLLSFKKGKVPPEKALVPIYSLPSDFPEHHYRALVRKCFQLKRESLGDLIPQEFREKYRLLSMKDALLCCHFPANFEEIYAGQRVLKYQEALIFCLKNLLVRQANQALVKGSRQKIDRDYLRRFIHGLSYRLTSDQKKAIGEIVSDMDSPCLMYRLLQGDVGSGKTLVAFLAMVACASRNEQSALMAPTDALAKQHAASLTKLVGEGVVLLTGNLEPKERKEALSRIASGQAKYIVGTHALFSSGVIYRNLGLAIIDEQHKFGVNQRNLLAEKGDAADLLLMSATPIPRTLSLALYGDLDVSTLTEFPCGKKSIETRIELPSSRAIAPLIRRSLENKKRIYVVAPQIEGQEDDPASSVKAVYEVYRRHYGDKVCLLHGQLSDEEKEASLLAFQTGLCPILVATSVIEVGIDVKEADLMLIYDPTHFALSSLHQLRGRIGRDGSPSTCVLVACHLDDEEKEKLSVLVRTLDGFEIAEEDLKRRGPGELSGTKQSGLPDFSFVNLVSDYKMLLHAREDATKILSSPEGHEELILEAKEAALFTHA